MGSGLSTTPVSRWLPWIGVLWRSNSLPPADPLGAAMPGDFGKTEGLLEWPVWPQSSGKAPGLKLCLTAGFFLLLS